MKFPRDSDEGEQLAGGSWNGSWEMQPESSEARRQELGEYGLVEAILREAIREYQKCAGQKGRRNARLFREVHQWFLADDRHWDFSFINVCEILDLEPTYIRTGLEIWRDRHFKQAGRERDGVAN
jgi:hypothetical protein